MKWFSAIMAISSKVYPTNDMWKRLEALPLNQRMLEVHAHDMRNNNVQLRIRGEAESKDAAKQMLIEAFPERIAMVVTEI